MKEKKHAAALILAVIHSVICILSLRYFSYILCDTVRTSCLMVDITNQGVFSLVFHPELLKESLPYYAPLLILHWLIAVWSVLTCILALRGRMSSRKGIISYSVLGICTGAEIAYFWMLENLLFSYESVNYKKLELACMTDARFYSPYGLFGQDGINLRFLTETNGHVLVKYVILAILLILSLTLLYIVSEQSNEAFAGESNDNCLNKR